MAQNKRKESIIKLLSLLILAIIAVLILIYVLPELPVEPPEPGPLPAETDSIRIYSFNIQIFGASKIAKTEVVEILTDIVSGADLIAIQEVRSATIDPVEQFMALLPAHYDYVLGPREGRTNSKEQYWIIYDTNKLQVLAQETWADPQDLFERNPLAVYFKTTGNFDFIVINNHIQPSSARTEISVLPEVIAYYQELWNESDVLVMGDFNADGSYFNESTLADIFPDHAYQIVITNDFDTTVAAGDNTYDRFIITATAREDYTENCGVIRFDEIYDFSQKQILPRNVSDHYPIWAEFSLYNDTD
ncbi:deoxyribonuclease [Spirochaetia bacterium]|nr:deoxyribonuclease [Spirochaetia bacterium]